MFTLIAAMYLMRMGVGHPGEGLDWRSTPKPWLLWVNTAILILSSVAFERTRAAARRGQMDRVAVGLLTAGFFAFAFLAGQLTVWWQLADAGYFLTTNPAIRLLLLDHHAARAAPPGRLGRLGPDHGQSVGTELSPPR